MESAAAAVIICVVFLLAGAVKGVIGFGLPLVSLGLLTVALDIKAAIALLLLPSLVTNFWQAVTGGNGKALWRRLWPFFTAAVLMIYAGTYALDYSRVAALLLGGIFILYAVTGSLGMRYAPPRHERAAAWGLGLINGFFTGMTGNLAFPGILFLQSIGLSRAELVQAMGILFTASTVVLMFALSLRGLFTLSDSVYSAVAVVPALLGMSGGRWLRDYVSEARFRQIFYGGVAVTGGYIISRNI